MLKTIFYLPAALVVFYAFVSCKNTPSDKKILQSITDSLQANAYTKNVSAAVADGKVTLNGTCEGADCVAETENKVKQTEGVKDVQNNLSMAPQTTDLTLRTQVQAIISRYGGVQADVANGVVILRGTVDRDQLQPLMSELKNLQASKIDNQLVVK